MENNRITYHLLRIATSMAISITLMMTATQMAVAADNDIQHVIPVVRISTENNAKPTFTVVSPPSGCWGNGVTDNEYVNGRMTVAYGDSIVYDSGEYVESQEKINEGGIAIRIRGNGSAQQKFPPYRIKLYEKADPLGFGYARKKWNLMRPFAASTNKCFIMDNLVGREVGLVAGMEWQPNFKYVELYLNDSYQGIYMMSDIIERDNNRIDVSKTGFITEVDAYWWNEDPRYQFHTPRQEYALAYTFKYPEVEDFEADPLRLPSIKEYMSMIEDKIYTGAKDLGQYISINSFVAWHWAHDILGTKDTGGSNIYMYKNDLLTDDPLKSKLKMGPLWDFDSNFACGVDNWTSHHSRNFAFGKELFKRNDFVQRYLFLCVTKTLELKKRIRHMTDSLQQTIGDSLNQAIIRHNKYCGTRMPLLAEQAEFINSWFNDRCDWIISNCISLLGGITVGIEGQGVVTNDGRITVYTLSGMRIETIDSNDERTWNLPNGMYIVKYPSGKIRKVVVGLQ